MEMPLGFGTMRVLRRGDPTSRGHFADAVIAPWLDRTVVRRGQSGRESGAARAGWGWLTSPGSELVDEHVKISVDAVGRANRGIRAMSVVGVMLAGGDSIADVDVLASPNLFAHARGRGRPSPSCRARAGARLLLRAGWRRAQRALPAGWRRSCVCIRSRPHALARRANRARLREGLDRRIRRLPRQLLHHPCGCAPREAIQMVWLTRFSRSSCCPERGVGSMDPATT